MAQWLAKLDGHEFDKKNLSKFFTEPTCHVGWMTMEPTT